MTFRFLIDEQLPLALARALNTAGFDARHVVELDLRGASDRTIWRHAIENDFIIVTKDADFPAMRLASPSGPQIVWIRLGNLRNAILMETLTIRWLNVIEPLEQGETIIEIT